MNEEENPFWYDEKGEQLPPVEHPVLGVCADCGGEATFKMRGLLLCFPCGYNRAN
jgi:hypothetical protein